MEQYEKGFQRFHVGEDVWPVTSCPFLLTVMSLVMRDKAWYKKRVVKNF